MIRLFRHYIPKSLVLLGAADGLVLFVSVYIGVSPPFAEPSPTGKLLVGALWPKALLYTAIMMSMMALVGLYHRDMRDDFRGVSLRLGVAVTLALAALVAMLYVRPWLTIGGTAMSLALVVSVVGISAFRMMLYRFTEHQLFKRRILILGAGTRALEAELLKTDGDDQEIMLLGYVHVRGETPEVPAEQRLQVETTLLDLCARLQVEELVVAIDENAVDFPVSQILDCKMEGIQVVDLVAFLERQTGRLQLDALRPGTMVFAEGFIQAILKGYIHRAFDICVSLIGLTFAMPIMLATAVAIFAESGFRGPILYRQVRVGRQSKPFEILKFRSMRTDAELDGKPQWARENDSRITRIGNFLRKTRIDELPQLVNVLMGTMSFVGPRPERPEFVESLSESIPYYDLRHTVNPGITGWAQICYPYGASAEDAKQKLQYDLYYIKNYSLFLDVAIMIQTAQVVLWGKGR